MTHREGVLTRNTAAARINHWITGICFVLLLLSGLAMFYPLMYPLSALFGGGQWTRAAHPWFGVVLMLSYLGLFVQFVRDNFPTRADGAWLAAIPRVIVNEEEGVPEVARFNAGQKFVFWSMTFLVPILFVTGLAIWEVYFSAYTSIETQRIAVLLHSLCAIAAILVWIVHVYAAIWVKGSIRAIDSRVRHSRLGVAPPPRLAAELGGDRFDRSAAARPKGMNP